MTGSSEPAPTSHGNSIGGQRLPARLGETYERRNPARLSEVVGRFAASDASDVADAVAAAAAAQPAWAALPAAARGAVLARAARALETRLERVADDMTAEMGKPVREARGETGRGVSILEYFAGEGYRAVGEVYEQSAKRSPVYTTRRPVGVVGLITPWNFPIAIPLWKLSPALAYGNTVVLKLAYDSPRTGLQIAECFEEAGLPAGVLNVLTGPGSVVGSALVADDSVDAISFTGSVPVGESVRERATSRGARVQLELGGHNPLVVTARADLDAAVEAAFAGAFWSAGQKCTATRRIYVQRTVYDAFREKLLARVESGHVGDPTDPQTEVGPLVNERQLADVLAAIERGRSEGGRVIAGGDRIGDEGCFVAPTVFEDVADDAFLSCEEVFGPVTSLYAFDQLDEALERANGVPFGLAASIYTQDLREARQFVGSARAGILHVNSQTAGAEVHVPFGGIRASGYGPHEQGRAAIEFYTDLITVYEDD
ncbi:MAG TPA: aldehyde dehydrogenase family protein [Gaiellaceae bacterium]|nr:aldehyde dehydrogenase family protein [Gaiellaceae bacterium]